MQSIEAVFDFARKLLGNLKSFGMLYNPGDANDVANKNLAESAAKAAGIEFKAIAVDAVGDIGPRAAALEGVDFIYAIPSSLLMPALPAIASTADRLKIPVISSSPQGAQDHVVLGAMSVSWTKVGYQAGLRAADILSGKKPSERLFRHFLQSAQQQGVQPHEILHIGSRILQDLAPARRMGMRTALFAGDKESLQAKPEQVKDPATRPDVLLTELAQIAEIVGT